MSFAENIKTKIKDADVERHLTELVDEGEKLARETVTKAGDIAHDKRDDVQGWLDKASDKVNDKTEGKYADQVAKLRDTLLGGLDKVATRRSAAEADGAPAEPSAPIELPAPDQ